jgi:large subunit ribosomal protein L15
MKLHDLQPAKGAHTPRTRVGRGIAAGKGKTAGRGTKGQKARAGGSIPPWFEGGQTPLHMRIPKLRGFVNKFKIDYEVVNLGDIARLVELGELEAGDMPGAKAPKGKAAPITVNQEILRAAGLVRRLDRPMKILGGGELSTALFVVADAFSASARSKIEAAGGTVSVLEVPGEKRGAMGVEDGEGAVASAEPGSTPTAATDAIAAPEAGEAAGTGETEAAPAEENVRGRARATADAEDAEPADAEPAGAATTEVKPKARKPRVKPAADA